MESFFLEVNKNIEAHVAERRKNKNTNKTKQNKKLISLGDKILVFAREKPNKHVSC